MSFKYEDCIGPYQCDPNQRSKCLCFVEDLLGVYPVNALPGASIQVTVLDANHMIAAHVTYHPYLHFPCPILMISMKNIMDMIISMISVYNTPLFDLTSLEQALYSILPPIPK